MTLAIDHLVVAATSLDDGDRWCEAIFGVRPVPGGRHDFMATHNRLLDLSSARHPKCYLEIIAIDPEAPAPAGPRWFGLDDVPLQRALESSPRLVRWAARTNALDAEVARWAAAGCDPGPIVAASRASSAGRLSWRLAMGEASAVAPAPSASSSRPFLIEWDRVHPTDALPASGVRLESLVLRSDAAILPLVREIVAVDAHRQGECAWWAELRVASDRVVSLEGR